MATAPKTPDPYVRLGLKPVINARSWVTALGGSLMRPEVLHAMDEAATCFVDMSELNAAAGRVVARACAAEAGLVTAGAAAGNLLMAAACMTGLDPMLVDRLPDTTGMKNEIAIFKGGRNHYDKTFETAGARLVEFGTLSGAKPYHLEAAINENTAAVAWIVAPFMRYPFPLQEAIEIAHVRDVPVIVDGAAEVPPVENLTKYIRLGADMVTFSGGKGIGGPQNTGLLAGRKDLIEAAYRNYMNEGSPMAGIGRPSKVSKESLVGLVTALELFLETDHETTWAGWREQASHVVNQLQGIPGLSVVLEDHDPNRQGPQAVIYFEHDWAGLEADEIREMLSDGDPPIYVGGGGYRDEVNIVMVNVQPGEEKIISDRLEEILRTPSAARRGMG